jgi:hypothetical protein
MSERKMPRYTIIGPPFIHKYGIVDEWTSGLTTSVLEPFYQSESRAERDCKVLNKAQAILLGERNP